jgi:hypothetical protein
MIAPSMVEAVRILFEPSQSHAGVKRLIRQPGLPDVLKARLGFLWCGRIDELGGLKANLGILMAQQPQQRPARLGTASLEFIFDRHEYIKKYPLYLSISSVIHVSYCRKHASSKRSSSSSIVTDE